MVEYVDELGRTRKGTRAEAREAETAKKEQGGDGREEDKGLETIHGIGSAHAEVL
jgi:hypothetical protein